MTEKRFKSVEEEFDWGTVQYFTLDDKKISDEELVELVNAQHETIQDQKRQLDELDGLLNKFEVTFEELEDILYMNRSRL